MATTSEVKAGLDDIAQRIREAINNMTAAKVRLQTAKDDLAALPTDYGDVVATINGYTPTGALETLAQDELAKLTAEFVALSSSIDAAIASL